MRATNRPGWALILSAAAIWPATAPGQDPAAPAQPSATIGSHQIDRYAAINQLRSELKADPNNLANWVILGELTHEVALDLPEPTDDAYYKISRDAYERALGLDPNNNGLKAAVQFARDQEANSRTFDAQRRNGVATYLDSRRREMATNGVNPTVLVYETPTPLPSTLPVPQPPDRVTPGAPRATQPGAFQPANAYPTPTYRPYANTEGQPYNYNKYQDAYSPAAAPNQAPPTTLRQFGQQLPGVLLNEATRGTTRPAAPR